MKIKGACHPVISVCPFKLYYKPKLKHGMEFFNLGWPNLISMILFYNFFQLKLCLSGTFENCLHQVDWETEQLKESLEYAHPGPKYSPKVSKISEQRDSLKVSVKIMLNNIEEEVFTESISRGEQSRFLKRIKIVESHDMM